MTMRRINRKYPYIHSGVQRGRTATVGVFVDMSGSVSDENLEQIYAVLGSLAKHGIREVRFAGGRWDRSRTSGLTLAVFAGEGLTAERLGEWYEASARATNKTAGLRPSRPTIDGRQGYRLDLLASEVPQTVIAWPAADGAVVNVVIGAGVPEADVQAAVDALR